MLRTNTVLSLAFILTAGSAVVVAAPANRILNPVDSRHVRTVGSVHRLANPKFDQGPVDPAQQLNYMMLMARPSPAQQAELDQLLADQQNPSSPQFGKWLTPEEFAGRFGLSTADRSKIVAWLQSEGFTIRELARGGNWIAFSGTAAQVSKSLHTSIHHFQVNGENHFANTSQPSVPEAIASVVGGFIGLHDFHPKPQAHLVPKYNVSGSHYLTPADFATIYNITPLAAAGIDGTGTSIAVVGGADLQLSDLQAFKKRYGLPANDPKQVLSGGVDPGQDPNVLVEVDLDLEWASAIAPKATIYYVYGVDPLVAILDAVNGNLAPIISSSYAGCEIDFDPEVFQAGAQQGNAQGITIVNASGDTGAAGCDPQGSAFATQGLGIQFPAALPEVTGVGGTQFVEGTGSYWAATNTSTFGSALSYIPEAAWNETDAASLGAGGGGVSVIYPRPAWQNGPGVPNDNARHTPDVAFSSAAHDGYEIYDALFGGNFPISGTSAAAPSMAGILALLNQYLVTNGVLTKPGLGNINPQLYRLAQSMPSVFHDVVSGNNIVPCAQGSPDCLTGSFGYSAGAGHDMATGLGSFDVNALATNWNSAVSGVTVKLSANSARVTSNDTITLTATVAAAGGSGTPTGTVSFGVYFQSLGTVALGADGTASMTFPAYLLGTGAGTFYAQYSGDAAFSSGGATTKITIAAPTGISSIIPSGPNVVWPNALPDAQGPAWQTTLTLHDVGNVASMLTGFTIDGQAQTVSRYFPQTSILPKGTISATFILRNQATPLVHTFGFSGVDVTGQSWSRQLTVSYYSKPQGPSFNNSFTATPLTVVQDTSADPSCQWPVQLHLDDIGGFSSVITGAFTGAGFFGFGSDVSNQVVSTFGTTRMDAYGSISGTLCFGGVTPPATEVIEVDILDVPEYITVSLVGPPANPTSLSADQASVSIAGAAGQPGQAALAVGIADPMQQWTASVFPANRTTGWLKLSQTSGTGPAQITLTADGTGFEPAAYRAAIVLQSPNAVPQTLSVPVMFVNSGSTSGTVITGVADPASGQTTGAPGMLLAVNGSNLANSTVKAPTRANPTPFSIGGVSATINGSAAPVISASPTQLMVQIPYSTGAGPAVLSVNNNGQVAGFQFQIAPSAPGIYTDGNGNLSGTSAVKQGGNATMLVNGAGDAPSSLIAFAGIDTGYLPSASVVPILPVSVTVGGVPAFLRSVALASNVLGETVVGFIVPTTAPQGVQPVVVTVGGVSSAPVNMTVQ